MTKKTLDKSGVVVSFLDPYDIGGTVSIFSLAPTTADAEQDENVVSGRKKQNSEQNILCLDYYFTVCCCCIPSTPLHPPSPSPNICYNARPGTTLPTRWGSRSLRTAAENDAGETLRSSETLITALRCERDQTSYYRQFLCVSCFRCFRW